MPYRFWGLLDSCLAAEVRDYHKVLPDGAIFIVDEAQKFFPVRSPSSTVPDAISHLEMHRHQGHDIVFITQHPSLIDHHARRLVGEHVHLQRNFGMPFSTLYRGNELLDTTNYFSLQKAEKSQFKFPKEVFALYKSAEVHTHKARFPKKLLLIPVLILFIVFAVYKFYNTLFNKASSSTQTITSPLSSATAVASSPGGVIGHPVAPTAEQIAVSLKPVIEGVPWTAPIYKDLAKPVTMPIVSGCVSSKAKNQCSCYSQQATVVSMSKELCLQYIAHHAFNPFKPDQGQGDDTKIHRRQASKDQSQVIASKD
jgi:zona occludens toxin